ncbi:LysE family translocator [Hyphobacterium sp.]|uniref:LysE family translocator n=1 Tax=Hyphobacterium sp. TaxID=2004662 RepID=UPI003B5258C7
MIDPGLFVGFAFAALLIELTPGPNMAWLVMLSLAEGRKSGLAATAGIATGLAFIAGLSAIGLAAMIARSDLAYEILRWAGALFMLYLAWEGWREAGETSAAVRSAGNSAHAIRGFVINALNPKAAIFYITVLPQFISPQLPVRPQALLLALLSVAIATLIHTLLVLLASSLRGYIENERQNRRIRRLLSLALVGVAVWLFVAAAH